MTAPNSDCAIDLNAVALDRRPQPAGQLRSGAMYLLIAVIVSLRAHDMGAAVGDSGEKMEQTHFVSSQLQLAPINHVGCSVIQLNPQIMLNDMS